MSISPYFGHHKLANEQDLYEDLVMETIQLSGVDVYYIVADRTRDPILGESVRSTFSTVLPIEAYLVGGGKTGGQGEIMLKFGFAQYETMEIVISKKRFINVSEVAGLNLQRPREGDLIFVGDIDQPYESQVNMIFEIAHLDFYDAEWTFGKTFTYKLTLNSFSTSHEKFETGTPLDGVMKDDVMPDMPTAINAAVNTTKQTLVRFDTKNPLSNI